MNLSEERIKKALQYKMGLLRDDSAAQDWQELRSAFQHDPELLERVVGEWMNPLVEIVRYALTHSSRDPQLDRSKWNRWVNFLRYLQGEKELPNMMIHRAASRLKPVERPRRPVPPGVDVAPTSPPKAVPGTTAPRTGEAGEIVRLPERGNQPILDVQPVATVRPAGEATGKETLAPAPVTQAGMWKYLPLPDAPDRHEESASLMSFSPEGMRIVGARVRGKKHKHEGTNCDDWFEIGSSGSWTILAVSDGAGSRMFSRVGARVSCGEAMRHLKDSLRDVHLRPRSAGEWQHVLGTGETDKGESSEDVRSVQQALMDAMFQAYTAVERAAESRAAGEDHRRVLGRALTVQDLSATLLLLVHGTASIDGVERSFVAGCQIGDGMSAAVDSSGTLRLLGESDSGAFSGETEFLTSRNKLEPDSLRRKIKIFLGGIRALMVMTDGVADDYFPNDPELLRLYCDLVMNGIVGTTADENTVLPEVRDRSVFETAAVSITADGARSLALRSSAAYAGTLGLTIPVLSTKPSILVAGSRDCALLGEPLVEERLRLWLDSYQVRGSFDDRTLVVMHREELP